MGFSRQEYWSGLSCPFPGDLPDPGIEPVATALQADFFFLNYLSYQGSPIKNQAKQLKITKDLNRHFTEEFIWMASKHVKRCSTVSLGKYILKPQWNKPPGIGKITIIKEKLIIPSAVEDPEQLSYIVGRDVKWWQSLWKTLWHFLKKFNTLPAPRISFLYVYPRKMNT